MRKLLFACAVFLISTSVYAQKEGYIWYFGNKAGLDFNPGSPPTVLTDGILSTSEGCAAISNPDGKLKFYTDGIEAYDRTHTRMPNGFGMTGNPSSTQSGVIIPNPGDTNIYYIFTVDDVGGPDGMKYSEVDMKLSSGNGDVVAGKKNIDLMSTSSEKITAVVHQNGRDIWVIGHKYYTDSFYAFLVTPAGVTTTPVKSRAGTLHSSGLGLGYLKASPDGKRLASALWSGIDKWEVFDFDNSTGKVSDGYTLYFTGVVSNYGVEFSPTGRYLYGTSSSSPKCIQFDLDAGTPTDVQASATEVYSSTSPRLGALQVAPDGKIYVSRSYNGWLATIYYPDSAGTACAFIDSSIYLKGNQVNWGLPTFIQSFFSPINFEFWNTCLGDTTFFRLLGDTGAIDSVVWNFGDPLSGAANISRDFNPWHIFTSTGTFSVCVERFDTSGFNDTTCLNVEIAEGPTVLLPNDTILCSGNTLTLADTHTLVSFLWSDSTSDSAIDVTTTGIYWLQLSNRCGLDRDSIYVEFDPDLDPELGPDTALCVGDDRLLSASDPEADSYIWSTGDTTSSITVTTEGLYWVKSTNACGDFYDSVNLEFDQIPDFTFPWTDSTACIGDAIVLKATSPDVDYRWFNFSNDSTVAVTTPGTYWVEILNHCGSDIDSTTVWFESCCTPGIPNAFTPNEDGINDEFGVINAYCVISEFELRIYNRSGQVVFQSNDVMDTWDGKIGGKDADMGVYVYWVQYSISSYDQFGNLSPAEPVFMQGNVTLIR